ncbi:hypothetical protein F5Y01DRAFT_284592, partial [Xylaria sp. FL0043]
MGIKHDADASFLSFGETKVPVHVTKQSGRKVNAERPPSNRQNASQLPRNGGEDNQPGDDNPNHPSGSGGGDGDGGGGGGDENGSGPAAPTILRNATFRANMSSDRSKWRWTCCNCYNIGSYNYDSTCRDCGHIRDNGCRIWAV